MKILLLLCLSLLLSGCLYFNDRGVSSHLYDNCKEYYDNCGHYHKECPENIIDYDEVGKGFRAIKEDITTPVKDCCESEPCTK